MSDPTPHLDPVVPLDGVDDLQSLIARVTALEAQTPPSRTEVFQREIVWTFGGSGSGDVS